MKPTEIQKYFDTTLYEMSNFNSNTTGLLPRTKLWVREEPTGLPHTKYRIKIIHPQYGSAVFAIWGDQPKQVTGDWKVTGKELKQIQYLINNTHQQIRDHIDGYIDSTELGQILKGAKNGIRN